MGGGDWLSSKAESTSSSSRPRSGTGISRSRVTLQGGSTVLGGARGSLWRPRHLTTTLLLETLWGAPEPPGAQGAQAELAPDRPPDWDQLLHHGHQGLLQLWF